MKLGLPDCSARFAALTTPAFAAARRALPVAMISVLLVAGCSKEEAPPPVVAKPATPPAVPGAPGTKPKGPTPVNEAELPKIPILPGYKYYVGGPKLKQDKYGKQRIESFQDEVAQPPSRGMIFGVKRDGDKLEYTVWGNGRILAVHRGTMRDGVYWGDYSEGYKNGKVVAREHITYDDQAQRAKIVTEEFDFETGESIRKKETSRRYAPIPLPEDMEADEDEAPAGAAPAPGAPESPGAAPKAGAPAEPAAPKADAAPAVPPAAPAPAAPPAH
jgi:hypothetical protein